MTGFPDAGYFADLQNTQGAYAYRGMFQGADQSCWNTTLSGGTNAACLAANIGDAAWRCLMAEYLTDHIATPMFIMNAAFDVYQVQHILDVGCVPKNCTSTQRAQMEGYRKAFVGESFAHVVNRARAVGHGAYIDSCLVHEQNLDYCGGPGTYNCAGWLTTQVAGMTPQQAYSRWYGGGSRQNLTVDSVATVAPDPGSNPSCPWNFDQGV